MTVCITHAHDELLYMYDARPMIVRTIMHTYEHYEYAYACDY